MATRPLDLPALPRGGMAARRHALVLPAAAVGNVFLLLLLLSCDPAWGNSTTPASDNSTEPAHGANVAAIVAPTVVLGVLLVVAAAVAWVLCVVKKKRRTEGTYRPSAEEQSGASSVAAPHDLKLPKEERLI